MARYGHLTTPQINTSVNDFPECRPSRWAFLSYLLTPGIPTQFPKYRNFRPVAAVFECNHPTLPRSTDLFINVIQTNTLPQI
jgi:hypothetical protein